MPNTGSFGAVPHSSSHVLGVRFGRAVAQKVVVRDGVVNPSSAVQRPRAAAPFLGRHVRMAATIRAVHPSSSLGQPSHLPTS